MQYIDRRSNAERVDCPKRTFGIVFDHFQNVGRPKALKRFGLRVLLTDLSQEKSKPEHIDNIFRHGHEIFLGRSHPVDRFQDRGFLHALIIPI